MLITFTPMRRDDELSLERQDDVLIVNGDAFDFSALREGSELPAEAVDSDWFVGPVQRVDGELQLVLILPHGPDEEQALRYPTPCHVSKNGPVRLPTQGVSDVEN